MSWYMIGLLIFYFKLIVMAVDQSGEPLVRPGDNHYEPPLAALYISSRRGQEESEFPQQPVIWKHHLTVRDKLVGTGDVAISLVEISMAPTS